MTHDAGEKKPFSIVRALASSGGSVDILTKLVDIIQGDLPKRYREFQEAVSQRNSESAARQVHTIRGQAVHFDAEELIRLAEILEEQCKEGNFEEVDRLQPELSPTIDKLLLWLESIDWKDVETMAETDD